MNPAARLKDMTQETRNNCGPKLIQPCPVLLEYPSRGGVGGSREERGAHKLGPHNAHISPPPLNMSYGEKPILKGGGGMHDANLLVIYGPMSARMCGIPTF